MGEWTVLEDLITDEDGGLGREDLARELDRVERKSAARPYLVIRTRYMMTMFKYARVCLGRGDKFAFWLRDCDLVTGRFGARRQQFIDSSPKRRYLCRGPSGTNGAYIARFDRHHTCPDWESLLKLGVCGIVARAEERLRTAKTKDEETFLKCVAELYKSFAGLLARWSKFASAQGMGDVATVLSALATREPRTLREAMQLNMIYSVCQEIEDESVRSQGLVDRLFIDFYRRDLAEGRETRASAKELVRDWFSRFYAMNQGNPGKNIGLGGYDASGRAVWNELTEIFFEVHYELARPSPKLVFRYGENTPKEHLDRVAKCLADGRTSIVFANEETLGETFRRRGKTPEEIVNFVLIGCYEPGIMGREIISSMAAQVNLAKCVEAVFNRGRDFKGFPIGPDCGLPANGEDFEREYLRQVAALVKTTLDGTRYVEEHWCDLNPSPMLSGSLRDCISNAADISIGGCKYNQSGVVCMGLPTAADSLAAIRYLVDEARLVSMAELADILKRNWQGAESLRLKALRTAPKWGNNDDRVDLIAKRIYDAVTAQVNVAANGHGGTFQAGFWTIDGDIPFGACTAATPEGRHAGSPIARNNSATAGCGREGVTALMLSNLKLDLAESPDGHILDVILPASAAKGERGIEMIVAALRTYAQLGGQCIHFNCFDSATLRDAMVNPEKYPDLQVRVCGWNVRWNDLSRQEQMHFLASAEAQER